MKRQKQYFIKLIGTGNQNLGVDYREQVHAFDIFEAVDILKTLQKEGELQHNTEIIEVSDTWRKP